MKLIDMLVEDGMNGWQWPNGVKCITQDYGSGPIYRGVVFGYREEPHLKKNIWLANNDLGHADVTVKRYDAVADDWATAIITREQYEAALAAKNEGWIEWCGGRCPVDDVTEVDIKFRTGAIVSGVKAGGYYWPQAGREYDIIAYRLHKPQEVEQAEADDEDDLNECIGQATAPLWNGEGLPPVGCECEYSLNGGKIWWKCKIDYIVGTQGVVMLCDTFEGVQYVQFSSYGNALKFRPIRSETERKRDAAKNAIAELCRSSASNGHSADLIYDAIAAGEIPGVKLED